MQMIAATFGHHDHFAAIDVAKFGVGVGSNHADLIQSVRAGLNPMVLLMFSLIS